MSTVRPHFTWAALTTQSATYNVEITQDRPAPGYVGATRFTPGMVNIAPGETITVVNKTRHPCDLASQGPDRLPRGIGTNPIAAGASYSIRFPDQGNYSFGCQGQGPLFEPVAVLPQTVI